MMKVQKAPLILHDFFVVNTKYKFIDEENTNISIRETFDKYELDFDFIAKKQKNNEIFLFTKIQINNPERPLFGYLIFLEAVSIFSFDKDAQLSDKEKKDYLYLSGLSIGINNLRTYIANTTSYYPLGKYQLPAIDLGALHKEKKNLQQKKEKI